jgi:hypothetical protein
MRRNCVPWCAPNPLVLAFNGCRKRLSGFRGKPSGFPVSEGSKEIGRRCTEGQGPFYDVTFVSVSQILTPAGLFSATSACDLPPSLMVAPPFMGPDRPAF